jgi:methylthioribose-1-phosphate isomerase
MGDAMSQDYPALRWQGDCLELLDQRVLPHEVCYLRLHSAEQVAAAITDMVVRGAPAIGIAAAYGAALAARQLAKSNDKIKLADIEPALIELAQSRPTAVNLFWALARVREVVAAAGNDVALDLEQLALAMHRQDIEDNQRLGNAGALLLPEMASIYTHCNAGALATGGYGTALGVIRSAHRQGKVKQVYAGETRPWLQGSRLTAWELQQSAIPVKLATEGAAGSLMRRGLVDWVIVGADRVARNGDVANKIGTYNLAVLARHHGVKFMVALPTATIDMEAADGNEIPIEERPSEEVTQFRGIDIAPHGVEAVNPVFDVTPAELVDALVTEKGVVERPDAASIAQLMAG